MDAGGESCPPRTPGLRLPGPALQLPTGVEGGSVQNHNELADAQTAQNMHELACVSGIAAAYRLGAEYREFDGFATDFFAKYLMLSHGVWYSREERRRRKAKTA